MHCAELTGAKLHVPALCNIEHNSDILKITALLNMAVEEGVI